MRLEALSLNLSGHVSPRLAVKGIPITTVGPQVRTSRKLGDGGEAFAGEKEEEEKEGWRGRGGEGREGSARDAGSPLCLRAGQPGAPGSEGRRRWSSQLNRRERRRVLPTSFQALKGPAAARPHG